jgi:EmrB/QacA subfamily drug resistance transporter
MVRSESPTARGGWSALVVLAGSQLLIVLDATIVNVALTDIGADLGLAPAQLQWVVTGYVLAFGGFLLLGGRLADRVGRRRAFVAGATAFAVGSLLAGVAGTPAVLFAGRVVQGLAAALLAPSALALLMTVIPAGSARNRALGVWGGVSASGTVVGLMLGGLLTEALSWRWVFWATVPVAALAAVVGRRVLPRGRSDTRTGFDVAGAVLGTGGLSGLVYGLVAAAESDWAAMPALPVLGVSAVLLVAFARLQFVRPHALLPLRLLRNRTVFGADLVGFALGAAVYGLFFFVSLFLGGILGYGPIATGLAFLPMAVAIAVASAAAARLVARTGARPLLIVSALLVTLALAGLSRIEPANGYVPMLLPALLGAGVGLGVAFVALTTLAVGAAPERDRGVAAGLFNAAQQLGGAVGLAVLTAVSTARTRDLTAPGHSPSAVDVTEGWSAGFLIAAATMLLGLLVTILMIRTDVPALRR